ncbi:hypothetical protein TNCV_3199491 [Trichonephila clavipes]|nr:hypothetical protein TNCV_3199491 [Trichonephila clavipes]
MTPEQASSSPNSNGRTLSPERFNVHRTPLHDGSSLVPGLEPAKLRRDQNHSDQATAATKSPPERENY